MNVSQLQNFRASWIVTAVLSVYYRQRESTCIAFTVVLYAHNFTVKLIGIMVPNTVHMNF